jgi:hypothetical protein
MILHTTMAARREWLIVVNQHAWYWLSRQFGLNTMLKWLMWNEKDNVRLIQLARKGQQREGCYV